MLFVIDVVVMLLILNFVLLVCYVEVDVKIVYLLCFDSFVIKVSFGFFDNLLFGLLSLNGLMFVLLVCIGLIEVVLFDNGYLMVVCIVVVGVVVVCWFVCVDVYCVVIVGVGE